LISWIWWLLLREEIASAPLPSWRRPRESYVRRRSLFLATARRLPELGMLAPLHKRRPPIKRLVASSP
jgi:hypothetical protein